MKALSFLIAFAASGAVQATEFCPEVEAFAEKGQASNLIAELTPSCGQAVALGGKKSAFCSWEFDFRAERATDVFERLKSDFKSCGASPVTRPDDDVNHPDSYSQEIFSLKGFEYSLSLKDKGALEKTLIFLRVE